MNPELETRELEFTMHELRVAAVEMTEALRDAEVLRGEDSHRLPFLHAYMLGCVIYAAGITPESVPAVLEFVATGYRDFHSAIPEEGAGNE